MSRLIRDVIISTGIALPLCLIVLLTGGGINETSDREAFWWPAGLAIPLWIYWFISLFKATKSWKLQPVRKIAVCFGAVLIASAFATPVGIAAYKIRNDARKRIVHQLGLDAHLSEYLAEYPDKSIALGRSCVLGSCVIVDMSNRDFSDLFYAMPRAMRPANSDDVKSIVQVRATQLVTGHYANGANAMRWTISMNIIDRKSNVIAYHEDFMGSDAPLSAGSAGASGNMPTKEVLTRLNAMYKP